MVHPDPKKAFEAITDPSYPGKRKGVFFWPKDFTFVCPTEIAALRGHGVDEVDFELWALAVSAMNGCGKCVDAREKSVHEEGASEDLVAGIIRVASVIQALSGVVDVTAQANPSARLADAVLVSA